MCLSLPFAIRFPFYHSHASNQIFLHSPLDVVDLDNDAVDIAKRLGRLSHFLQGAKRLLTCCSLTPDEFCRYSRKVGHSFCPVVVSPQWNMWSSTDCLSYRGKLVISPPRMTDSIFLITFFLWLIIPGRSLVRHWRELESLRILHSAQLLHSIYTSQLIWISWKCSTIVDTTSMSHYKVVYSPLWSPPPIKYGTDLLPFYRPLGEAVPAPCLHWPNKGHGSIR